MKHTPPPCLFIYPPNEGDISFSINEYNLLYIIYTCNKYYKYIFYIKLCELSEFWTACESFIMDSGAIPEESSHSGAIPVESGHSCGFRHYSGAIPPELPDSGRNLWGTVKYWEGEVTDHAYLLNISLCLEDNSEMVQRI